MAIEWIDVLFCLACASAWAGLAVAITAANTAEFIRKAFIADRSDWHIFVFTIAEDLLGLVHGDGESLLRTL